MSNEGEQMRASPSECRTIDQIVSMLINAYQCLSILINAHADVGRKQWAIGQLALANCVAFGRGKRISRPTGSFRAAIYYSRLRKPHEATKFS
jgi:hypothetical protein